MTCGSLYERLVVRFTDYVSEIKQTVRAQIAYYQYVKVCIVTVRNSDDELLHID